MLIIVTIKRLHIAFYLSWPLYVNIHTYSCCNISYRTGVARDQVRTSGALQFVLEMVYSEPSHTTMQTALMALGCAAEKNGDRRLWHSLLFLPSSVYMYICVYILTTQLSCIHVYFNHSVVNQMKLCESRLFKLLTAILSSPESRLTLLHSVAYLLGCLMAGNGSALYHKLCVYIP